jgi:hypothetical protein
MAKFKNFSGPIPGVVDAEFKRIKLRLDDLGLRLPPDEARGVKGNIATGGRAWKALAGAETSEEARALIEAIMHSQVRHLNSDYDSIPKWGLDDADLDDLRDDCWRRMDC